MNIVVATGNVGKVEEINKILSDWDVNFLTLKDVGLDDIEIIEDGSTFEENAIIKAKTIAKHTQYPVLSDDSGLCIDYLKGAPGIYSARYAGEDTTFEFKRNKILKELDGVEKDGRGAYFFCSVCLIFNGDIFLSEGKVDGLINDEEVGDNGFGYDPIFYYPPFNKTFAEVSSSMKDSVSHRYNALKNLELTLIKKKVLSENEEKKYTFLKKGIDKL